MPLLPPFKIENIPGPHLGKRVTRGPQWSSFRKSSIDKSLPRGCHGTVVGHMGDNSQQVYVSWDGFQHFDFDFYNLGTEVVEVAETIDLAGIGTALLPLPGIKQGWRPPLLMVDDPKVGICQDALMKFDPADGGHRPYPSHAAQYREWHGRTAWLFNPWTGKQRDPRDIGSDVTGLLIVP